jgi:FixJ family two-component response regulator
MPLVVVIEDDPASQKTLARVLRAGGYMAATYASAEEYLSSPPASAPLGMLLDVHLGGMSGLDLQRRLKNEGSTVPVIVITAFDDPRGREQAEQLGCVAYLRKPCAAETILALLRRLVEEDSSRGALGRDEAHGCQRQRGS